MLRQAAPSTMGATLDKLQDAGLTIECGDDWIRCSMNKRPHAIGFRTREYPGLPTDMQAQLMALNTIADGTAVLVENIFENRYMHVQALGRMGAQIAIDATTPEHGRASGREKMCPHVSSSVGCGSYKT